MTQINKQWESMKKDYINKVEKALSSVKHPRSEEILEDVRAHLDRRYSELYSEHQTQENLQTIITEMCPASDYAELLEPNEKHLKSGPLPKYVLAVLAVILIVIGLSFMLRLPRHPKYGPYLRAIFKCNFTANPFFSVDNFNKIQVGMTTEEVLDMIGYPQMRNQLVPPKDATQEKLDQYNDEVYWDYTRPAFDGAKYYNDYSVITSLSTGTVLRTRKLTGYSDLKPRAEDTLFPKKVGNLEVQGFDGQKHILKESDDKISIILVNRQHSTDDTWINRRKYQKEQAEKLLAESEMNDVDIFFLDWNDRERILGRIAMDSDILIYKKGILYSTPVIFGSLVEKIEQSYHNDRIWLIKRLTEND